MATEDDIPARSALLDPVDRLSEVMFGLLMTLTFTGTASVTLGAGGTVQGILIAALGCNIAWGIVDGVMYVLRTVTERRRSFGILADLKAADRAAAPGVVRTLFSGPAGERLNDADAEIVAAWLKRIVREDDLVILRAGDLRAAGLIFLLVVASTLPPVVPFVVTEDVFAAMRWSNGIAVAMLFVIGWQLDTYIRHGSRMMRIVVPLVGVVLVGATIALGG